MVHQEKRSVRKANAARSAGPPRADAQTVQSVDRALAIVELLLRAGTPLSTREVALGTGINRTTAHRLLASLHRRGWIERASGTTGFRPSLRYLALVRTSLGGRDFVEEVRPTMERLSLLSRETIHLGVLDNHDVLHIAKVDSPEIVGLSSRVGTRATPHLTGLGKALLAAGSDEELAVYIAQAQTRLPPDTLTDPAAFRQEIGLGRQRGFSIDDEESSPGVRCLAVAIRGVEGRPLFALSLTGPAGRFTLARLGACVPEMLTAAQTLSTQFGGEMAPEAVA
jgi:IclR family transcriptional regulator, acetate operon repressor